MANTTNVSTLTTDFNVYPYYDDYDESKGFYRILFRPGYAVQGRELTQMQTILQKQVNRFGKHVFREGSIVLPGEFIIENDIDYVKVKSTDSVGNNYVISNFLNDTILSSNTGIRAQVINVEEAIDSSPTTNTNTLYVRYINSSNANSQIKTFQVNDLLTANAGTLVVYDTTNPIGKASRFVIREGVYFAKEHFIRFPTQSIILSRYDTSPTCRVGFEIVESLVNHTMDSTLLDPALESSNFSAPGADRFKLDSILTKKAFDDTETSPNFVELFKVKDGVVTSMNNRSQYNILGDELAKRTLDESGDYYVRGLSVRVRENLDVNDNGGFSANGSANVLSIGVEPGLGYAKGYPVELLVTQYVELEKATTYRNVSTQLATATAGSYIKANNYTGSLAQDYGTTVTLLDQPNVRLSGGRWASSSALGNPIGIAKVRSIEYDSNTLGSPDGTVKIYLSDIRMNGTNSFANTRSVYATNFGADNILENGVAVLKEPNIDTLIYDIGTKSTKTLRDTSGTPQMEFNFKRTSFGVSITNGSLSVPLSIVGEQFPYGTTTLGDADKKELILTIDSDTTISTLGSVVSRDSDSVLTANATTYFNKMNVGDKIQFSGNTRPYYITTINSATQVTVSGTLPTVLAGNTISKVYKNGDVIDLTSLGYGTGTVRAVSTTPTQISIDLHETFTTTGSISYQVNRYNAREANKILRSNCYVLINTTNSVATTTGPYGLGFSDVYKLRSIKKVSNGEDVTSSFNFDNGQRDALYDHATISPKATLPTNTEYIVNFDYFEPSFATGRGYFSVDSYPINDTITYDSTINIKTENIPQFTSPKSGFVYDLRNSLDFRPVKSNTATYVTSPASSPAVNPSTYANFKYEANGLRLPVPSTQMSYDYSFYLPRRDLVVIDKDKNVYVRTGVPDVAPITPKAPDDAMLLASLYVSGYPSLATNYAQNIGRLDLACIAERQSNIRFTMRDIGVLKSRIENLEYYNSLNLLQQRAVDMNILDDNNLNRFKNGVFVDTFVDHTFGDINNKDYKIVVDTTEKSIRPLYTLHSFNYDYLAAESSNIQKTGNLLSLPYTEVEYLNQPAVTSYRNVELSSYRFVGTLELDPDIDTWVDTINPPDEQVRIGPGPADVPQSITTYQYERAINGYLVGAPVGGGNGKVSRNYGFGGSGTAVPVDFFGSSTLGQGPPQAGNDQPVYSLQTVTATKITTTYSLKEQTTNEGVKLVNVGVVPYIRGQTIDISARGLKRNTRVYLYFDGEDLSIYASQITEAQYNMTPDERRIAGIVYAQGGSFTTDSNGNIFLALTLPSAGKKFRIGQKEVVITDSPTNSVDATTYAKGYFVAEGISKTIQGRVVTTASITGSTSRDVSRRNETVYLGYLDNPSCTAYSFMVKAPPEDEGMFLTSVDLFFQSKHPTLGVWFEIRAMDTGGNITRTQVPYSEVWLKSSEITVSPDGYTSPTNVKFKCPIFLNNNVEYAFVIHTEGLNPDTYLWIARLGETDVRPDALGGGKKYNSRPLTGTFYTTNNNLNWNIVDDIDLRIKFYRASFSTGVQAVAILGNESVESLVVGNVSSTFASYGEPVVGNYRLTLTGNTSYYAVGDYFVGSTSGANSKIVSISGSTYTMSSTNYVSGERVTHRYGANATTSGYTSAMSSLVYGSAKLYNFHVYSSNSYMELTGTNGQFKANETITGGSSNNTATISSIENFRYSKISFEPSYLTFRRNNIYFEMRPTSNVGVIGVYVPIYESTSYYFDEEQAVFSKSNEITSLGGERSNKVRFTFSTTTDYLSPVIDISRTRTVYEDNIINANTTYGLEASPTGGELINKYISQPVALADGQDAEDMNVYLTGYRPPGTDILVWCKLLNREDSDILSSRNWIPMEKSGNDVYSSLANRDDFKEYKFVLPASYLTSPATDNSPGGAVQYVNSQGITFTGYKYFAIKIGLAGTNSAIVPRVADLRVIALQI